MGGHDGGRNGDESNLPDSPAMLCLVLSLLHVICLGYATMEGRIGEDACPVEMNRRETCTRRRGRFGGRRACGEEEACGGGKARARIGSEPPSTTRSRYCSALREPATRIGARDRAVDERDDGDSHPPRRHFKLSWTQIDGNCLSFVHALIVT